MNVAGQDMRRRVPLEPGIRLAAVGIRNYMMLLQITNYAFTEPMKRGVEFHRFLFALAAPTR